MDKKAYQLFTTKELWTRAGDSDNYMDHNKMDNKKINPMVRGGGVKIQLETQNETWTSLSNKLTLEITDNQSERHIEPDGLANSQQTRQNNARKRQKCLGEWTIFIKIQTAC